MLPHHCHHHNSRRIGAALCAEFAVSPCPVWVTTVASFVAVVVLMATMPRLVVSATMTIALIPIRWGGLYGVDADFVALENCKMCSISAADIKVLLPSQSSIFSSHVHAKRPLPSHTSSPPTLFAPAFSPLRTPKRVSCAVSGSGHVVPFLPYDPLPLVGLRLAPPL